MLGVTQITSGSTNSTKESVFVGLVPTRLLDTRENATTFDGFDQAVGQLDADTTYELDIADRAGVPTDATSVSANVVAVNPSANGYLTVYPCGVDQPLASTLNYQAGNNNTNEFSVPLGPDGDICIYTRAETDIVVDIYGYYIAGSGGTGEQGPEGPQGPKGDTGAAGQDAVSPARVIWVADDGTGDFTSLSAALASITDATATKPYVIKIAPGVYTETANVAMKDFVDVEGSGQGITTVKGSCSGIIDLERSTISFGQVNSQIRHLTIEAESNNQCVAVYSNQGYLAPTPSGYSPSMEFVTVLGKGSEGRAIINELSELVVANSEVTAEGSSSSSAMYNDNSNVQLLNSTAKALGSNTSSWAIWNFGITTTQILNSTIDSDTYSLYTSGNTRTVFYVMNTQLLKTRQPEDTGNSTVFSCVNNVTFDALTPPEFEGLDEDCL
ncbi:pectinesterase family protein [bacterium]|nr:pectinesterase family protein [bacterium]